MIRRVKIDRSYTYRSDDFLDEKVHCLADHCEKVLDFGKSSRHRYTFFEREQVVAVDINQFDDYPDIISGRLNNFVPSTSQSNLHLEYYYAKVRHTFKRQNT